MLILAEEGLPAGLPAHQGFILRNEAKINLFLFLLFMTADNVLPILQMSVWHFVSSYRFHFGWQAF